MDTPDAPKTRLDRLTALADALEPTVLDIQGRSEHGLQGASGLIGQYRAMLAEIDELSPKESSGDGIDEIAARRAARRSSPAEGKGRAKRSS